MVEVTPSLDRAARDDVVALLARVAAHDGVAAVGEAGLLRLRGSATGVEPVIHLRAFSPDGFLAGYAWSDGASAELAVDPACRRHGHGTALLRTLRTRDPGVAVWSHGALAPARALAEREGLRVVRALWQMAWTPSTAPLGEAPPLPAGLRVRPFSGSADGPDGHAWVALNARIFATHPEQGRLNVADLAARMAEPWFHHDMFLLVTDTTGALVAYLWLKAEAGSDEVYVIGVAPELERRGIAAHLLHLAQRTARERRRRALTLYVEGDNLTAIRTYVRAGFERGSVDVQYAHPG